MTYRIVVAVLAVAGLLLEANANSFEIRMPNVRPQRDDIMLCYSRKIESPIYLTAFEALANKSVNHHIIIYGCPETSVEQDDTDRVWNCGEMTESSDAPENDKYQKDSICPQGEPPKIIYGWAMGAPPFKFPEGVSFEVGTPKVRYLVMQQHYKDASSFRKSKNTGDKAGVRFTTSKSPTSRLAGIFLLSSGDAVMPAGQTTYLDITCPLDGEAPTMRMHPFAYRTHTHDHGKVVSGYRIRHGKWMEIGRQSPQMPQTFYNITTPGIVVREGDILAARCTMENNDHHDVEIGSTQYDEMCNFYIYYYTERGEHRPSQDFCVSPGWPYYSWFEDDLIDPRNIPSNVDVVPPPPPGVKPMDHHHNHEMKMPEMDHDNQQNGEEDDEFMMPNHGDEFNFDNLDYFENPGFNGADDWEESSVFNNDGGDDDDEDPMDFWMM